MRERSNSARKLADAHLLHSGNEAFAVALDFIPPDGKFQTEGDRFRMNAMSTADLKRVFVLESLFFEDV